MKIDSYGFSLRINKLVQGSYKIDFYKHEVYTHSIIVSGDDVEKVPLAFPKYEIKGNDANAFFIDATSSRIGIGISTPPYIIY